MEREKKRGILGSNKTLKELKEHGNGK